MEEYNDYDEDGNNIVPCPICLNVYCLGNQFDRSGNKIGDGKCPDEDEFVKSMTPETPIRTVDFKYKETAKCASCERPYGEYNGFPDLVLPHDVRSFV